MARMNEDQVLAAIHSHQKYGSRLGLERMSVLMNLLGNPEKGMKVIHVAGTNGKGSVCRYLQSVLTENGYRVGLYTSPYLQRFSERMEFDGQEISPEDLVACAEAVFPKVEEMIRQGYEPPTEFELVTALAFVYFSWKPMDFLVLEVGLGGRGDSTNIIDQPVASVITSISFDHMEQLGNSLGAIAYEKAGIIKPGCPVIAHVHDPVAKDVIRQVAQEQCAPFHDVEQVPVSNIRPSLDGYRFQMGVMEIELGMLGLHQVENGVCALTVIELLEKQGIIKTKPELIQRGMANAKQAGRMEILHKNPHLLLDGAHNEAGVLALAETIKAHFAGKKILLVVGVLADKDVDRMISGFQRIEGDIAATEPDNPRKLGAAQLCERIRATGRSCVSVGDDAHACDYIDKQRDHYDVIVVSGSLYLIGKVRERMQHETT